MDHKCNNPHCHAAMADVKVRYKDNHGKLWSFCSLECFLWKIRDILKETRKTIEEAHELLCK